MKYREKPIDDNAGNPFNPNDEINAYKYDPSGTVIKTKVWRVEGCLIHTIQSLTVHWKQCRKLEPIEPREISASRIIRWRNDEIAIIIPNELGDQDHLIKNCNLTWREVLE